MRQKILKIARAHFSCIASQTPGNGVISAVVKELTQLRGGAIRAHEARYSHNGMAIALGQCFEQWAKERSAAYLQHNTAKFHDAVPQ